MSNFDSALNEFAPLVAAIRIAPAVAAVTKAVVHDSEHKDELADKLAAQTNSAKDSVNIAAPHNITDEECYEDENGNMVVCKKCAKKMQDSVQKENKYIDMTQKKDIVKFLMCLNEKNYAEAHKYLSKIMQAKLYNRMVTAKGVKLF